MLKNGGTSFNVYEKYATMLDLRDVQCLLVCRSFTGRTGACLLCGLACPMCSPLDAPNAGCTGHGRDQAAQDHRRSCKDRTCRDCPARVATGVDQGLGALFVLENGRALVCYQIVRALAFGTHGGRRCRRGHDRQSGTLRCDQHGYADFSLLWCWICSNEFERPTQVARYAVHIPRDPFVPMSS